MTAEVVVINKEAIAMAADSAVTLSTGSERKLKIYTSANKIFRLSKKSPIGIMVYGNSSLMGVPWEIIIKIFREEKGYNNFNNLTDTAESFIKFITEKKDLFPEELQEEFFELTVTQYFHVIFENFRSDVNKSIPDLPNGLPSADIRKILATVIDKHYTQWKNDLFLPTIPKNFDEQIEAKYCLLINRIIDKVFEKLPVYKRNRERLVKIASYLFVKSPDSIHQGSSGVVIAGFGSNDIYPSMISYDIYGIVENVLKYKETKRFTNHKTGAIFPFAQRDMVDVYMSGISPKIEKFIKNNIQDLLEDYPKLLFDQVTEIDPISKEKYLENIKKTIPSSMKKFQEEFRGFIRKLYIDPIMEVTGGLPKEEMAAFAESLVNITTMRQKMSSVSETVGGPIDVAVITKGDGFIWIKRKHYFKPELNPHFFQNYFQGGKDSNGFEEE